MGFTIVYISFFDVIILYQRIDILIPKFKTYFLLMDTVPLTISLVSKTIL